MYYGGCGNYGNAYPIIEKCQQSCQVNPCKCQEIIIEVCCRICGFDSCRCQERCNICDYDPCRCRQRCNICNFDPCRCRAERRCNICNFDPCRCRKERSCNECDFDPCRCRGKCQCLMCIKPTKSIICWFIEDECCRHKAEKLVKSTICKLDELWKCGFICKREYVIRYGLLLSSVQRINHEMKEWSRHRKCCEVLLKYLCLLSEYIIGSECIDILCLCKLIKQFRKALECCEEKKKYEKRRHDDRRKY